jgi:outer membrane lipoprotein-sorting protein
MKKIFMSMFVGLLLTVVLAGCGEKSQEDVTAALEKKVEEMTSYKADAKMTLQTGNEPQVYEIEVWRKKPIYYRVLLKNASKEQSSQMILRNDDGVFVLTPALNKSFRFQSDWPENSSQAYLYESLISDILNDSEAKFTATEGYYVYETNTNYQNNKALPRQEITLDKKTLAPVMVKVMDQDMNPLVQVDFSNVEFNAEFDEGAFEVKSNMTRAQIDIPTMATSGNISELLANGSRIY